MLSPEAHALLDSERAIPPQPAAVRARAIARARAALKAGIVASGGPVAPVHATPASALARSRWAAGVLLACMGSAAIGATAFAIRARLSRGPSDGTGAPAVQPIAPAHTPTPPPAPPASAPAAAAAVTLPQPAAIPTTVRPHGSRADAMREELRLLRRARAAVAREDFAAALSPITEHARRFNVGRLAEEREALRVRALVGLGRNPEARRAAASFAARFPHSVLLPAVRRMPVEPP